MPYGLRIGARFGATDSITGASRIEYVDVLRGVAVLGILAVNIVHFGEPYGFSVVNSGDGAAGTLNVLAWLINWLLLEGTMRGLLSLLFGVGIVLYMRREGAEGGAALDLHGRRMLWLIAFGLVNSHVFLWRGDILFEYAVTGLFLFPLRKLRPRWQILLAVSALLFITARGTSEWLHVRGLESAEQAAMAAQRAGQPLTQEMQATLDDWRQATEGAQPTAEAIARNMATMRGTVGGMFRFVTKEITDDRTITYYRKGIFETGAMLLIGMALLQLGAFDGSWARRRYLLLALAGYGLGLAIRGAECFAMLRSHFDPVVAEFAALVLYQPGRVAMTLGHVGAVALLCRAGALRAVREALGATGRMALTNYLSHSLICLVVFTGLGFGLYGRLERYQLYYVVAAIWALQLAWSSAWLNRFRFGPAEYLWRALVSWRLPPFRRSGVATG